MNRHRTIIAVVLWGSLSLPTTAIAGSPTDATAVRIEVEVSVAAETGLPADDPTWKTMRRWVTDNQTTVLEGAGFVIGDDATRVIRTELDVYGEYGVNTRGRLMLVGDTDSHREFTCEACKDSEILAKIEGETIALTEHLKTELPADQGAAIEPAVGTESETATPAASGDDGTEQATGAGASDDAEEWRLGVAGYTGFATLAVGLGMTLGGVIVLTREPEQRLQASSARFIETAHRRPLGGALTGVGAGLLATGVVLLVMDRTVLLKRRAHRNTKAKLAPSLTPNGAGLFLAGRF